MTGAIFEAFKSGGVVYKIACVAADKEYIGATINSKHRFATHLCSLRAGKHYNKELLQDFTLYGESAFSFSVISSHRTYEAALRKEARLIKAAAKSKHAYNIIVDIDVGAMKERAVACRIAHQRIMSKLRSRNSERAAA